MNVHISIRLFTAAAAAKSLQLCPTLCDPVDGSLPVSPVPGESHGQRSLACCSLRSHKELDKTRVTELN